MNTPRALALALTLALAACAGSKDDDDTPAEDDDTEDTDDTVVDTDDTDVDTDDTDADTDDTDLPPPCDTTAPHVRVVLDPSAATAEVPERANGRPVTTRWVVEDSAGGSLTLTSGVETAVIVEFSPPLSISRLPDDPSYLLDLGTDRATLGGVLSVPLDADVTQEGTLPGFLDSGALRGTDLAIIWRWYQGKGVLGRPAVGDELTCLAFTFTPTTDATATWGRTRFTFDELGDTSESYNPLQPGPQ